MMINLKYLLGKARLLIFLIPLWSLSFPCQSQTQSQDLCWTNQKGDTVLTYTMTCIGQLYPGSKYSKWKVKVKNTFNKNIKCEAIIVAQESLEVSEAIALQVGTEKETTVIFLRVDIKCDQNAKMNFNRVSYKKNKTK